MLFDVVFIIFHIDNTSYLHT